MKMHQLWIPKAVIFDLDGVLWHSSNIHARSFIQAFAEVEVELPEDIYAHVAGMKTEAAVVRLMEMLGREHIETSKIIETVITRKRELAIGYLNSESVLDPETVFTLQQLQAAGYKLGLATSASYNTMTCFLNQLPAGNWFDSMVCGSDVSVGKPAPNIFLVTAMQLKMKPSSCAVIEDSLAGVQAALAAGMHVITYRLKEPVRSEYILAHCEKLHEVVEKVCNTYHDQ